MADIPRIGVPGEVDAFVHHVDRKDEIVGCSALAEDGAVIPDAGNDPVATGDAEAAQAGVDGIDERGFGQANIVG